MNYRIQWRTPHRPKGYYKLQCKAHLAVRTAVKKGKLIDLKVQRVDCVDCGWRAQQYDHSDYTKPLEVEPVCICCNSARGPAVHEAATEDGRRIGRHGRLSNFVYSATPIEDQPAFDASYAKYLAREESRKSAYRAITHASS